MNRPVLPAVTGRILLALGDLGLLLGLDAALLRLGLPAPLDLPGLAQAHGMLMVFGFVGTLVALERAVAVRRAWALGAPALLGVGSLLLILPLPEQIGQGLLCLGMLTVLDVYTLIWRRQHSPATAIQALGAMMGLSAAILWLGGTTIPTLVPFLATFLLLTITGERLELARISPTADARAEHTVLGAALAIAAGAASAALWPVVGYPLLGLALAVLVFIMLRYDPAIRLLRSSGLPRYVAACLLAGYAWLLAASGIWLTAEPVTTGWAYDAVLHSVFLGFIMSMIMAHTPVILPAVLHRPLPYRPLLFAPVALLHASLLIRILLGDARHLTAAMQWGGALNVAAVLSFLVLTAVSTLRGTHAQPGARTSV